MKRIKVLISVILAILIFSFSFHTAYADMGPKPASYITIKGIEGDYVACFAATEAWGPNSFYDGDGSEEGYNPIKNYSDEDGYKYITRYYECSGETEISFTYYCPEIYKIVIYKDSVLYMVTEPLEMYAYATYYEIDFSTGTITTPEDITIKKTYNYGGEILGFIVRVTITLIIEIGFFFLTHLFTKHNFKVVVITNVITQLLLNIILNVSAYHSGTIDALFLLIGLEFGVMIIEVIVYNLFMKDKNRFLITLYPIISNILSFIGGLLLFMVM